MPLTIPRDDFPFPSQDVYDKVDYLSSWARHRLLWSREMPPHRGSRGRAGRRHPGMWACLPSLKDKERRGVETPV